MNHNEWTNAYSANHIHWSGTSGVQYPQVRPENRKRSKLDKILSSNAVKKYGLPDELTRSMLIWHHRSPWKSIVIHRDPVPHNFPMPHPDFFEQTINYRVPPELFDEVGKYDGSVKINRTKGEASAKCDKEAMNILALNLMNDIVSGQRSVEEARTFYAERAIQFNAHHKPSRYTTSLLFPIPTGTADPDKPVVPKVGKPEEHLPHSKVSVKSHTPMQASLP